MQDQAIKGIYVYRMLNVMDKSNVDFHYYGNIEDFFYHNMYVSYLYWNGVGYDPTPDFTWDYGIDLYRKSRRTLESDNYFRADFNLVVCDDEGKIYPPEYLNDRYKEFHKILLKRRDKDRVAAYHQKRHGRKRKAYGGFRKLRTFQERKKSFAFDEEYFVKVRSSRNASNLPDSWDDYQYYAQKSWKYQSKRKRQWK